MAGIRRKNVQPEEANTIVKLLESGLTAKQVAKQTRRHESTIYKIRREMTKVLPTDPELGPHRRELFYFGQFLRDRLCLHGPGYAMELLVRGNLPVTWGINRHVVISSAIQPNAEKESVEKDWGHDARQHPLFAAFRQHLAPHSCWAGLEQIENDCGKYRETCEAAYQRLLKKIKTRTSGLSEEDVGRMAQSLLQGAYFVTTGAAKPSFLYEPQRVQEDYKSWWRLQLESWSVGHMEDPAALKSVAEVHQELAASLPSWPEFKALMEADRAVRNDIGVFRQALSLDARLRKLILNGRCHLCP